MFLGKEYILANELTEQMGIHMANISMLRKRLENGDDYYTVRKLNGCTFINSTGRRLPNNIKEGIRKHTFTDFSDKLPCTYVRAEYGLTDRDLSRSGVISGKVSICGKEFYQFTEKFRVTMQNKIGYVLDKKEHDECMKNGDIEGSIELDKNKFWTWYGV